MALSISDTGTRLKLAVRDADINGNGILATQEIKTALSQKAISRAERDFLTRVAADAGNSRGGLELTNYDRKIDTFVSVAKTADKAGTTDGVLSKAEVKASANEVKVGTTTVWAARSMLTKFERVSATSTPPLTEADLDKVSEMWNSIEQAVTP